MGEWGLAVQAGEREHDADSIARAQGHKGRGGSRGVGGEWAGRAGRGLGRGRGGRGRSESAVYTIRAGDVEDCNQHKSGGWGGGRRPRGEVVPSKDIYAELSIRADLTRSYPRTKPSTRTARGVQCVAGRCRLQRLFARVGCARAITRVLRAMRRRARAQQTRPSGNRPRVHRSPRRRGCVSASLAVVELTFV